MTVDRKFEKYVMVSWRLNSQSELTYCSGCACVAVEKPGAVTMLIP